MTDSVLASPLSRADFFEKAGAQSEYVCASLGTGRLLVKTEDDHIGRALFVKGGRGDIKVLHRSVSTIRALYGPDAIAGRTFIDVGANIGSTTVSALLSYAFADALALEPEPQNNLTLRLNLVLNGVDDRVTAMAVAASNAVGTLELVVTPSRSGKHFIASRPEVIAGLSHGEDVIEVPVVTLDSLAAAGAYDPDRVGLLWIDAENHEPEILEGASSLVSRGVPVLMEWDPDGLAARGNPGMLEDLVAEHYTHVANMRADVREGHTRYELKPAKSLRQISEEQQHFTDILVLRLTEDQVPEAGLAALLRAARDSPDDAIDRSARTQPSSTIGMPSRWISKLRELVPAVRRPRR